MSMSGCIRPATPMAVTQGERPDLACFWMNSVRAGSASRHHFSRSTSRTADRRCRPRWRRPPPRSAARSPSPAGSAPHVALADDAVRADRRPSGHAQRLAAFAHHAVGDADRLVFGDDRRQRRHVGFPHSGNLDESIGHGPAPCADELGGRLARGQAHATMTASICTRAPGIERPEGCSSTSAGRSCGKKVSATASTALKSRSCPPDRRSS